MAAAHLRNQAALRQLLVCFVFFLLFALVQATEEIAEDKLSTNLDASESQDQDEEEPYCTFFNNRKPEFQPNLKNCTWYQDHCCCRQVEIEVAFGKVKALQGSTRACQKYINYLICYICAPTQYEFYLRQRLWVCEEFCDLIFDNCKDAILKGSRIGELYKNGTHFCESRRFEVAPYSSGKCFYFNETMDTSSDGVAIHSITVWRLMTSLILIMTIANI